MPARRILLAVLMIALASAAHAGPKSIFDEDWVPPKPVERPTPTPTRAPTPAPNPAPARSPTAPDPALDIKTITLPAKRLPVPTSTEQADVRRVMKEVFAAQLTDRTPAGRKKLLEALSAQADKSADVPTERFVLLAAAQDAAIEAVDLTQIFRFADEMGRFFEVDALAIKAAAVPNLIAKPQTSRDATLANVRAALEFATELTAAEDYNAAVRICQALIPAAASDTELRIQVQTRVRDLTALRDATVKIAKDFEKLKATPADAAANLAVGRYYCFFKNDWPRGLKHLVNSNDAELKAIAQQELAGPATPSDVTRLAEGWWTLTNKQSDPTFKSAAAAHVLALYESALPNLTGLQGELAKRRITDATKLASIVPGAIRPVGFGSVIRMVVTVVADKTWQPACDVRAGDVLVFTATGLATVDGRKPMVGPEGQRIEGRAYGALCGQIGSAPVRELFTIGSAFRIVVGRDGLLTMRADDLDSALGDNKGEFKVTIVRHPASGKSLLEQGQADRFALAATDMVCRAMKAGTYEVTAEGQWSNNADGPFRGPDGKGDGGESCLIAKLEDGKTETIGKGVRFTLQTNQIVRFKMNDGDGDLNDNRGSINVTIKPMK